MTHVVANDILIPEIRAILMEGRDVRFTPSGVSMRPFIEGGRDAVILRHLPEVRVGDICLCDLGTHYVLHRVIALPPASAPAPAPSPAPAFAPAAPTITLQGDGIIASQEHCTLADVIGTVIRIENPKGHRKPLTRGRLWWHIRPLRKWLLKFYRKLYLPLLR